MLPHGQQQVHTFRTPAKPIPPPTPRASVLGLDRLAQDKRAAEANGENGRKRPRLEETSFKGMCSSRFSIYCSLA